MEELAALRIQNVGLPLVRQVAGYLKPTTPAAQLLGRHARRRVAELAPAELERLRREGEIPWRGPWEPGYVFLAAAGQTWGCGLYLEPGRLLSRLPKNMALAPDDPA